MKWIDIGNIKRGPWTTVIGIALIIGGFVDKFGFDSNWTEALVAIGAGLILIFFKDPNQKPPKDQKPPNPPAGGGTKAGAFLIMLGTLMSLTSCVTYNKCVDKFGSVKTDTITVTQVEPIDISYKGPKESFTTSLRLDSLLWATPGQRTTLSNADSTVKINIQKDPDNDRVSITADCDPDTVRITKKVPVKVKVPCDTQIFKEPESTKWQKGWNNYKSVSAFAFPVLIILIIIIKR